MNRIRHCFLEIAPQMERYLVLPATDDPWATLAGSSGPVPLALSAAVGFLVSLLSLGLYGQRAFRRDLEASTVAFPAGNHDRTWPAGSGRDQESDPEG
jgi:hypothetical protein